MTRLTRPELRAAIVLVSGGLMAVLDATIVAVALPRLMATFGTSLTSVQWVIAAYTLAMVATMPLAAGLATAAAGAVLVAAFAVRALTHQEPLLRVRLLGDPAFGRGAAVLALYAAPSFGSAVLLPTYVQTLRSDSVSVTAALMIPGAVGMGLGLQVAARLLERLGPRLVVGAGLGLAIASGFVQVAVLRADTPYVLLGLLGLLQGVGTGAIMMPTISSSSRDLHGSDLASGSALLSLVSTIANGMGTVAVSALFTALTAVLTGGASIEALSGQGASGRGTAAVDALRLTQVAALVVMSIALVVRLRPVRSPSAILDAREPPARVERTP
ncbi:hypothetical protein ACWEPC_31150 [Nonomuraea sp. NPDC004297]